MVCVCAGFGMLIELWKIKKAVSVSVDWSNTYHIKGIPVRCPFVFDYTDSYAHSQSKGQKSGV